MRLQGLHHITAITGDAQQNLDFYTRVLGLRLAAKTVNQDDPSVYHLFYADEQGRPGSELTFFEYPRATPGRAPTSMSAGSLQASPATYRSAPTTSPSMGLPTVSSISSTPASCSYTCPAASPRRG